MNRIKYIILLFIFFTYSCKKEVDEIEFRIKIVNTSPLNLQEFQENIELRIEYSHPEGYIGFADPDLLSIEVHDSRLPNPDLYHLQPLAPPNQSLSIQGIINIEIDSPFRFGNGNSENLSYNIRIQDKNGKWSNTVTTPMITINE